jgi:hypothetical protein
VPASVQIETHGFILDEGEARLIHRQLAALGVCLAQYPVARVLLVLRRRRIRVGFSADLSVQLGPLGAPLVGHRDARLAALAASRAVGAVRRQLAGQTLGAATRRGLTKR